ncbi:ComEC/Rec2 family competence protein [Maricaulis sp.]|uniref:ComEC/Rec2 family competence protein n=1 Tax=Maricaulis sp. TaxID=1486257 RepID=UPI003A8D1E6D
MRQPEPGYRPGPPARPALFVLAGRPAILAALGFAAGCAAYFALPAEPSALWSVALAGLALAALLAARAIPHGAALGLAALAILAFAAGLARAQLRSHALGAGTPPQLVFGRPEPVTGWLEAVERNSRGRARLSIRLPRSRGDPVRRVRVLAAEPQLQPGDAVSILAIIEPPRRAPVPGSYDFRFNAYFAGIVGSGFAIAPLEPGPELAQDAAARAIARWRWQIAGHLRQRLPGRNGAMAAALLTGDRSGLTPQVSETLRAAGLGHVLAISGMHMALFAGGVFLILRFGLAAITPFARRFDAAGPAAVGALLAGAGYFLLSGGAIPTQRAFLMTAAVLTGVLVGRRALSLHTLALAMIFVLALQPEAVRGAGFQMSFAAVAALIACADLWFRRRRRPAAPLDFGRGLLSGLGSLSLTSLIAGLATSGFAAFHFHRIAGFGLAGNLLAMPVFTFIVMPAGVAALFLMPFGLDGPALMVMSGGLDVMFAVADRVAGAPGALQPVIAAPGWVLPLYAAAFVTVLLGRGPLRLGGAGLAVAALIAWSLAPAPDLFISEGAVVVARDGADRDEWQASTRRRSRFAVTVFLEQRGAHAPPARAGLECDDMGCRGQGGGLRYVVLEQAEDWATDCDRADLLVLMVDLPVWLHRRCRALVLDRARLDAGGGTLVWTRDGAIVRMQTVSTPGSNRPWERRRFSARE